MAKLYYNLLLFHSTHDTWLGIIPLKQLNNSWKWLDGSDVFHEDMKQRFIVDDWGSDENEPNISQNTTYKDAINSIAEHFYLENLHCTLLILSDENDAYPAKYDFARCDKTSRFYCQKRAEFLSPSRNARKVSQFHSNVFLILTVIALTVLVLFLLTFGSFNSRNHITNTEATAFYANQ